MSDRDIEDQRLLGMIRDSYTASGGVYGARRVFGELCEAGESCGKHRVAKIMRANKIKAVRGYKSPRRVAGRPSIIAPNRLNRQFTVDAPDRAWVTDITYLRTWQRWLYLAVIIDLHSRKVIGWSMKPTLMHYSWRCGAENQINRSSCIQTRVHNRVVMTGSVSATHISCNPP
jgi:putative transposase